MTRAFARPPASSPDIFHKVGRQRQGRQSGTSPEQVHSEAQAKEEQGGAGRAAPSSRGGKASGDLHLGNDKGREGDMGRQSGAVGVDEGLDFLCFLIAGLNLQSFWRVVDRNNQDHNF